MCAICGGTRWDSIAEWIWQKSEDRGRDDRGIIKTPEGPWIGNHRATPTTEVQEPLERQPVGNGPWFVLNGIIANDEELGVRGGEADTSVLPRVIHTGSLDQFAVDIIAELTGSYAIACLVKSPELKIYLACNYKPIWIAHHDGQSYFSSLPHHFPPGMFPHRMDPYTIMDLESNYTIQIPRSQSDKALVIASAGLDSTAVAAYACHKHGPWNVRLLHYQYGCLASTKERELIPKIALRLECGFDVQVIPSVYFGSESPIMRKGSTIAPGVAGAEYAHEWVPARNLVMLSLTTAYAEANSFGHIYLGTNLEEGGAYPDNEEQFIRDFDNLLYGAVQNGVKVQVHTPVGHLMKHEIVPFGNSYGAPFELTWSCYRGGETHCGNCGPCFMRRTAFLRNGLMDPVFGE